MGCSKVLSTRDLPLSTRLLLSKPYKEGKGIGLTAIGESEEWYREGGIGWSVPRAPIAHTARPMARRHQPSQAIRRRPRACPTRRPQSRRSPDAELPAPAGARHHAPHRTAAALVW